MLYQQMIQVGRTSFTRNQLQLYVLVSLLYCYKKLATNMLPDIMQKKSKLCEKLIDRQTICFIELYNVEEVLWNVWLSKYINSALD